VLRYANEEERVFTQLMVYKGDGGFETGNSAWRYKVSVGFMLSLPEGVYSFEVNDITNIPAKTRDYRNMHMVIRKSDGA